MQKPRANSRISSKALKKARDPVPPEFRSLEEEIEFWENHDLTDYPDYWQEVKNVGVDLASKYLRLEKELAKKISQVARQRGISSETLVNLWLQQKLAESSKLGKRRSKKTSHSIAASR